MSKLLVRLLLLALLFLSCPFRSDALTLEQIISRENPAFKVATAQMAIGRDGRVYLSNLDPASMGPGYLLRLTRDGREPFGSVTGPAPMFATANAQGIIATANAHFTHAITLHNKSFETFAAIRDFSPAPGYVAPRHVEAGVSGDFYGLDQNKDRILRITPNGKVTKIYTFAREGAEAVNDFRVDEKGEAFYLQTNTYRPLRKIGFDGKTQWSTPTHAVGGFDVGEDGTLYIIDAIGDKIQKFGTDGTSVGEVKLQLGELQPTITKYHFKNLRVWNDEVLLKRAHPTEVFLRFDGKTGAMRQAVSSRFEELTVTLPDGPLVAGTSIPFTVEFTDPVLKATPQWRVWMRTLGALDWRELNLRDGKLQLPEDTGGIYQIKVTPEVMPWQRGRVSEYIVQTWCEIRKTNSKGTINIFTPSNRNSYARREAISATLLLRSVKESAGKSLPVVVQLVEANTLKVAAKAEPVLESRMTATIGEPIAITIPESVTAALRPGHYLLQASAPEFTTVPQPLEIGEGLLPTTFQTLSYGDYTQGLWPIGSTPWDSTDLSIAHAERMRKLGVNLLVERLNFNPDATQIVADGALKVRLEADELGVAPEKVLQLHPFLQTLAAYGGRGIQQMGILLTNDAGLPLGTEYGVPRADEAKQQAARKRYTEIITKVMREVKPYVAFRGWSWAANWWLTTPAEEPLGAQERKAYAAAVNQAYETGKWNPLFDKVADVNLGFAPQATEFLNGVLKPLAPDAVTAVAAPYRNGQAYPPISFKNVDEVDLQAQWEQIAPPVYAPHDVDYYKRPGKRAFGHPELWNDSGTGDQILPTLWQMTMRGANGVGFANELPQWGAEDSRSAQAGTTSIYRALNGVLRQYGPLLNTLQNDDDVAIVVSGRMIKLDAWKLNTFWGVFEAYISCLHAHHPASIVFADDLQLDSLKKYKAVLVVNQKVEMEAPLAAALKSAKAAGVAVFYDKTCRSQLVKEYTALDVAFDKVAAEPGMGVGADEATYTRMPGYIRANLPALQKALDSATPRAATIQNDEVWVSRRKSERGEYLFVVNNSTPELGPEHLWRVNLFSSVRVPVQTSIGLPGGARYVYDVFAMKPALLQSGAITADLRTMPLKLYAILPAAISKIVLRGPTSIRPGQTFKWWAQVRDASDKPIDSGIPIRLRLLAADGRTLEERFLASGSKGIGGEVTLPLNTPAGVTSLEATELLSGKSVRLRITANPTAWVASLDGKTGIAKEVRAADTSGVAFTTAVPSASEKFGPHLRDVAISSDGKTALFNAMNWDTNLFALDTATGKVRWRERLGQYFAFAPQAQSSGFAVQGFDFNTPEGYHLYFADDAGKIERRFALYGVPPRAPFRMYSSSMHDTVNNFATAPDGSWVASAGDLGLAVWSRDGRVLWTRDDWKNRNQARANPTSTWASTKPHTARLFTLDERTLLVCDDMNAVAHNATSGAVLWQLQLSSEGEIFKTRASHDGKVVALLSTSEGGQLHLVRDGKVLRTLSAPEAYDFDLSPDGSTIALVTRNQLKVYSANAGLQWILPADDYLRFARFSPDGARIAASSDMGSLYVLDRGGELLHEKDMGALVVPAWLPNGDLILGNWMGTVVRLDAKYSELWRTRLSPVPTDMRGKLLTPDTTATTRITSWGNAETKPLPLTPNLLALPKTVIRFPNHERVVQNEMSMLTDGKPDAPANPWLWPGEVNQWAGLRFFNTLSFDLPQPARATGITFVEDAKNPSSWLRDADIEYFDEKTQKWAFLQTLLSNSAVHTHRFAKPVETTKLRIILPFALYGNLRLGEIVLHGETQ